MNHTLSKGHRERLKKKFIKNPAVLEDYEILELLLFYSIPRKDTKNLAKELLNKYKTLNDIISSPNIIDNKGIGENTLILFQLIKELNRRIYYHKLKSDSNKLNSPQVAFNFIKFNIDHSKEQFGVVYLNDQNQFIHLDVLFTGTINKVNIYPREFIAKILSYNATRIILFHNHPFSIITKPSQEDIKLTKHLIEICKTIEVEILDHLVINSQNFFSFKNEGLI